MILVTGASGFIGSELVKQLCESGQRVRALKRPSSVVPAHLNNYESLEWVNGDLLDYFSVGAALEGVTQVYHCAALVSINPTHKRDLLRTNVEGTAHLVNLCLDQQIDKLVHLSSVAALGESKNGQLVTEQTNWEFNGNQHGYSISKYESEMEVWRGIAEGLRAAIVNPSLVIGPGAGSTGSGQIFERVRQGTSFYTRGSCGLVDVRDVARAMIRIMESDISGERFLLNADNWTIRKLMEEAAGCFEVQPPRFEAKPWMLSLGWRVLSLLSLVSRKSYPLNRDIARSAVKTLNYSGEKIKKFFPSFEYHPVEETIKEICRALKR